jgi:hypothetical protein
MKTKATMQQSGTTLAFEHPMFEGWQEVATDDLVVACRALLKRADSPSIKASELEELRLVAAELRRRSTLLRFETERNQTGREHFRVC